MRQLEDDDLSADFSAEEPSEYDLDTYYDSSFNQRDGSCSPPLACEAPGLPLQQLCELEQSLTHGVKADRQKIEYCVTRTFEALGVVMAATVNGSLKLLYVQEESLRPPY
jgi:hypothetical protein